MKKTQWLLLSIALNPLFISYSHSQSGNPIAASTTLLEATPIGHSLSNQIQTSGREISDNISALTTSVKDTLEKQKKSILQRLIDVLIGLVPIFVGGYFGYWLRGKEKDIAQQSLRLQELKTLPIITVNLHLENRFRKDTDQWMEKHQGIAVATAEKEHDVRVVVMNKSDHRFVNAYIELSCYVDRVRRYPGIDEDIKRYMKKEPWILTPGMKVEGHFILESILSKAKSDYKTLLIKEQDGKKDYDLFWIKVETDWHEIEPKEKENERRWDKESPLRNIGPTYWWRYYFKREVLVFEQDEPRCSSEFTLPEETKNEKPET
jgi:hypothetical protein